MTARAVIKIPRSSRLVAYTCRNKVARAASREQVSIRLLAGRNSHVYRPIKRPEANFSFVLLSMPLAKFRI